MAGVWRLDASNSERAVDYGVRVKSLVLARVDSIRASSGDRRRDRLIVVKALLLGQLIGSILIAGLAMFAGVVYAYSALLGGFICLIPNAYFAYRTFKFQGARAAKHIIRSFYMGEAVKLGLTAGLFTLVFVGVKPLAPLALFIGFVSVQMIGWIVPLVVEGKRHKK